VRVYLLLFVAASWLAIGVPNARADSDIDALSATSPAKRAAAAKEVAARGLRRAIPKLIAMLDDDDAQVRLAAVEALRRMRAKAAVPALLVRAQVDHDAQVRGAAAQAVLRLRPRSFAGKLGSAEPSPVAPPPLPPLRPRARYATHFTLGTAANALRVDESFGGTAGAALRWGDIEAQLSLGYPAMSLGLRLRWLMLRYPRLSPYLVGGSVAVFNNGNDDQRTAVAVFGGVGLRWYLIPPIFVQLEVVASYVLHTALRPPPAGATREAKRFALPVTFEIGLELWP
jgi:hypothetical protein